ncbi:tail fiber protein [Helicobacter phage HPy1R]|nr:tail fiber protein [Helicobacter phage HPy1R]
MMILENACEYKEYLPGVFNELGFSGSFEVVGNAIHLNIITSENQETPTKDQVLEKLQESTLKTKKQEIEAKLNAICKEKIINGFKSEVLGSAHVYNLTLEDQANLQALITAGIDSIFRCAEVINGVVGFKTYKKHTKAQILQLAKEALKFKQDLIVFYGREKERLKDITSLEALEKFTIKEYLT